MKTICIAPPNALILVMDFDSGQVPEATGKTLVSATETCTAVGCRSEHDGATEIHLAQSHEVTPSDALAFSGNVCTPRKTLPICTVLNEEMLSTAVSDIMTHVRVFANDRIEPDRIFVIFDL